VCGVRLKKVTGEENRNTISWEMYMEKEDKVFITFGLTAFLYWLIAALIGLLFIGTFTVWFSILMAVLFPCAVYIDWKKYKKNN
jgi:hypothetical protein